MLISYYWYETGIKMITTLTHPWEATCPTIVQTAQVEWVVLYLAKSTNFESQLPEETQSKITKAGPRNKRGWIPMASAILGFGISIIIYHIPPLG
jgi:hypothetical protein